MTPLDTVKKNLSLLSAQEAHVSEKKLYELSELSRIFYEQVKDDLAGEEVVTLFHRCLTDGFLFEEAEEIGIPKEYASLLREKRRLYASAEVAAFALFLSERMHAEKAECFPWREKATASARISYVPIGKAERAYFALAEARAGASVHYADSAADAVAALLSHRADFVLLPFASAKGEALPGIHRLWMQNDLLISALVNVYEGEEKLVYALFSSEPSPYVQTDRMALTFKIALDSYAHLGRLLSVLPVFGYKKTALATEGEDYGRIYVRLSLAGEGDATALWLYLSLYAVSASLLGRYPILETLVR